MMFVKEGRKVNEEEKKGWRKGEGRRGIWVKKSYITVMINCWAGQ